ncbi:hypothetical protein Tsubulata_008149 [Turnera subulata]|uniref:Peptidase M48 domain-containing protein n=1 Tax=Turnera subulata TaxID=218843 RepID=A0A9Q0JA73_9ROSI|nr:hypothetical protein Tsubulata_008149 [Turnera subulata]
MSYYRVIKLALDALRNSTHRTVAFKGPPPQAPASVTICEIWTRDDPPEKFSGFSFYGKFPPNLGPQGLAGVVVVYVVWVTCFKSSSTKFLSKGEVYEGNHETVPYTTRKHFVRMTKSMEIDEGEKLFREIKRRGLLCRYSTDAKIAAALAHEVAHVVARHIAEGTKLLCKPLGDYGSLSETMTMLLSPLSRRQVKEADYIGLMLMAAAGYDPRIAPQRFDEFDEVEESTGLYLADLCDDLTSTHPSDKERAQFLSQPHVMGKALTIYEKNTKRMIRSKGRSARRHSR